MELLAIAIRGNKAIRGIIFKNEEIKLIQFADDLTCSLADINSGQIVFEIFKSFELVSGLRLNKLKTQGMWLGNKKYCTTKPFDISWPEGVIRILGIYVGHNIIEVERANFEKPVKNLELQLNVWESRNLSLKRKSIISWVYPNFCFWHT